MNIDNSDLPVQDELTVLKARADQIGVKYHPSIGLEALKAKLAQALSDAPAPGSNDAGTPAQAAPVETENQMRQRMVREATVLVRVRVTCMNPLKKEWPGEILAVGNDVVGSIKKFIPYQGAEDGWHVPKALLDMMREKQCQVFYTVTLPNGQKVRRGKLIKEFAIEVLPPLTADELHDLAQRQALSGAIDQGMAA